MKPCSICHDTSPDDAAFCIICGRAFGAVGATERLSSAGVQTQRLDNSGPSFVASAVPVGTIDKIRLDTGANSASYGTLHRIVYAGGIVGMGSVYLGQSEFSRIGFGSAPVIIVKGW